MVKFEVIPIRSTVMRNVNCLAVVYVRLVTDSRRLRIKRGEVKLYISDNVYRKNAYVINRLSRTWGRVVRSRAISHVELVEYFIEDVCMCLRCESYKILMKIERRGERNIETKIKAYIYR